MSSIYILVLWKVFIDIFEFSVNKSDNIRPFFANQHYCFPRCSSASFVILTGSRSVGFIFTDNYKAEHPSICVWKCAVVFILPILSYSEIFELSSSGFGLLCL